MWKIALFYSWILNKVDCFFYVTYQKTRGILPLCSAAAVASERMAAPTMTPCDQLNASYTNGTPERFFQ